jgi:large subunit ribosomal protein L32
MAVPFRRTSKTAKRLRRGHFKLTITGKVTCPHCGALIDAHTVCPECGYYKGKDILHLKKAQGEPVKK